MRESRVRGGAATWPSLAAVAVCGGMQKRNDLAARAWAVGGELERSTSGRAVGCEASVVCGLGGLTCHWYSRTGKLLLQFGRCLT